MTILAGFQVSDHCPLGYFKKKAHGIWRHDKTCNQVYRPCPTRHGLYNYKNGYVLEMSDLVSKRIALSMKLKQRC